MEKTISQKDTCTPVFIVELFIILRIWKQPKYPPTDEWIKKMWYTWLAKKFIWVFPQDITEMQIKTTMRNFPGGPVAENLHYQYMWPGFDPQSGN